ncbi:hypothetical protein FS749_014019 [Ceratobasidium sp. UAMH 11750]|nr:hypothetical protein FS749_014019 [Ceratobasidium sp. UAMH 11750]
MADVDMDFENKEELSPQDIADLLSTPGWKSMYIVVSPGLYSETYTMQGDHRCYNFKIGDGRSKTLEKSYATYVASGSAIQLEVQDNANVYLKEYDEKETPGVTGVGKLLERAIFSDIAPPKAGVRKTEWFTITSEDPSNNETLTKSLQILLNNFAGCRIYTNGLPLDHGQRDKTLKDLEKALGDIRIFHCARSSGFKVLK